MAQTPEAIKKTAAKRLGITLEEYNDRIRRGLKHCYKCKRVLPLVRFYKRKRNSDGHDSICKDCGGANLKAYRERRYSEDPNWMARAAKKYRGANQATARQSVAAWGKKNKHKQRAQFAVNNALASGLLVKPKHCEMCGCERPLVGHHDSYDEDRRLVVTWLCRRCHGWIHLSKEER